MTIATPKAPPRERVMRPPLKWTPDTVPVVIIEVQDALGVPQPDTGYVDATGIYPGRYPCICGRQVIVAHHATRPGGEHPVILDAVRNMRGPWRVYAKRDRPDIWLATFDSADSEHAMYVNHRAICPTARIDIDL